MLGGLRNGVKAWGKRGGSIGCEVWGKEVVLILLCFGVFVELGGDLCFGVLKG